MDENKPSRISSRADKVGKQRKINRIYNILLGIVIVAIIVVLVIIFTGNDEESQATPSEENSTQQQKTENTDDAKADEETKSNDEAENDESEEQEENVDENLETESIENATVVENSDDSNVEKTYENENWQAVGTTQTGEHVTDFTMDSTDWNEMEKALAYGAGLDESNMTLYWLGNGGATDKAIGTVSPKDKSVTYRVYIQWIDGSGWKPYKVEQLKTNDR